MKNYLFGQKLPLGLQTEYYRCTSKCYICMFLSLSIQHLMIFLELKIHISFPFSFLSKLLTTHSVSILKAEEIKSVFMCVMPYIIGRKYFIPPYNSSLQEIRVFRSDAELLFAEMLLVAIMCLSSFRKHGRLLKGRSINEYYIALCLLQSLTLRGWHGAEGHALSHVV